MKINTKTMNVSLSPSISEYIEKRLTGLEKFLGSDTEAVLIHILIGKMSAHHRSGDIFKAEIDLSLPGKTFHVEAEKDDLYVAIDAAKDELVREIKSGKEKQI